MRRRQVVPALTSPKGCTMIDCLCCGVPTYDACGKCVSCESGECDPADTWHCFTGHCDGSGCSYPGECETNAIGE